MPYRTKTHRTGLHERHKRLRRRIVRLLLFMLALIAVAFALKHVMNWSYNPKWYEPRDMEREQNEHKENRLGM
jgi:hypothetical protein